ARPRSSSTARCTTGRSRSSTSWRRSSPRPRPRWTGRPDGPRHRERATEAPPGTPPGTRNEEHGTPGPTHRVRLIKGSADGGAGMGGVERSGRLGVATLLLAVLALLAIARSTIIMVYLGVTYFREVDPISVPLSYYAFVDGGEQLFFSAAVALAVGALAVLVG